MLLNCLLSYSFQLAVVVSSGVRIILSKPAEIRLCAYTSLYRLRPFKVET